MFSEGASDAQKVSDNTTTSIFADIFSSGPSDAEQTLNGSKPALFDKLFSSPSDAETVLRESIKLQREREYKARYLSRIEVLRMNAERVLNSFTQTADLPSKSQKAILSVYVTLASTVASSIIGYYVSDRITFLGSGLVPALGVLVATVALFFIPATNANLSKRRSLLWLIGWLMGAALRPLLQEFFYWGHEALVYAALGSTFVLFTSFSLGVLSSNRRQVIYLVSSMFFALCTFGWIRLLNFFYPTNALLSLELLLGLASTCAYTIMHTQMMLDDIAMGVSADPIWYSLTFFNDLVQMFIRLLVILANNKERRDREEEGDRDKRRRRNQARTGAGYTSYRSKAC